MNMNVCFCMIIKNILASELHLFEKIATFVEHAYRYVDHYQ